MTELEFEESKLELQRQQFEFEREKWNTDVSFRERQVDNEETEQKLRKAEFELRREEHKRAGWRNPLVVAILAATIAAIGNAVVTVVNGSHQRAIESQKSESARILEMIKTAGDADKAAENLSFLLKAGLVDNPIRVEKLNAFLKTREPGTGPSLAGGSVVPSIIGIDDAVAIESLPLDHPIRKPATSVGLLQMTTDNGFVSACTAFLIDDGMLLTADHCIRGVTSMSLTLTDASGAQEYPVSLPALAVDERHNFALLKVPKEAGSRFGFVKVSDATPSPGQSLVAIYYRGAGRKLAVVSGDCRVVQVDEIELHHRCDTGGGSSGAPLLSRNGLQLLGLHHRRGALGGIATRTDAILSAMRSLNSEK